MSGEEGNENDHIPVKDTYDERARGNNAKIIRDGMEDRYLHVSEENLILKKHLRKQEEKIKQLATKLVRLVGDRNNRGKKGDILLEDQKCRITELEGQVNLLRDKLLVARQQLGSYTKLVPGSHKIHIKPKPIRNITSPLAHTQSEGSTILTDHVTHLLIEARAENQELKDRLQILRGHISTTELELVQLREQITMKEVGRQEEILVLRSQADIENESKKKKLADNVQFIRLQRDSKRTASWLATYEAQCRTLESNLNSANEALGQAEYQLSEVQEILRQEQHKSIGLMKQVEDFSSVAHQLKEVEARLISLQEENRILKDGHESLVAKALETGDKIKRAEKEDNSYKIQVAKLESSIRSELQEKSELIAQLSQEKAKYASIEQAFRELEVKSVEQADTLKLVKEKLDDIESKSSVGKSSEIKLPDNCEGCARLETDLNENQWQLVQVREELTKTKNLLKTQISINKEYQKEIEILSTKLEKSEVFHHEKLQEFMRILEERADQMTHLEKNLESLNLRPVTPPSALPKTQFSSAAVVLPSVSTLDPGISELILIKKPEPEIFESKEPESSDKQPQISPRPEPQPNGLVPLPIPQQPLAKIPEPLLNSSKTKTNFPTLDIHIDKYVPAKGVTLKEGLFVTWEPDESVRNYSPLVLNGIFNTRSKNVLKESFPLEGIEVQLHTAVGPSHCRLLATAFIVVGSNLSVAMHSAENDDILGDLVYSCLITNAENTEVDFRNNNEEIKHQSVESELVNVSVPTPTPKPRTPAPSSDTSDGYGSAIEIPLVPRNQKKHSWSNSRSPKKSILKIVNATTDSLRHEAKHVLVSDLVDERENSNTVLIVEPMDDEFETGPPDFIPSEPNSKPQSKERNQNETLTNIPEENSVVPVTATSEQRKKHRRKRPKQMASKTTADNESDADVTYSLESGTETSRNVSDIESLEEEEYSHAGMRIEISYVQFNEKCRVWSDAKIKKFFVEYSFLNYPPEELETATSLHKPQPGHRAEFNFVKVFRIDTVEKRKLLREMVMERKRLRFTLVSEPAEDDTIDCEDLGYAYVCFNEILQASTDLTEEEIPVYDAENHKIQVGVICISVQAIQVLKTL